MFIIIGLGNPGAQYERARHNVGFMLMDILQKKLPGSAWKSSKKFYAVISEANAGEEKILLAKPQTFMNASGKCAAALYNFYKEQFKCGCGCPECDSEYLEKFWLAYDDIDLPLGKIRIRKEGSAGSHNGMKSVIQSLGLQNFARIRIGIESRGNISPSKQDITSFVLEPFRTKEKQVIQKSLEKATEALMLALEKGIAKAMDKYNI